MKKKSRRSPPRRTYQQFLQSAYWKDVRLQVLKRDGYRCQECGRRQRLQVHHLTYRHHGKEGRYLQDLVTLCKNCHRSHHVKKTG
jgi:5-methylcytosine-specific restriction endonuclease McrA